MNNIQTAAETIVDSMSDAELHRYVRKEWHDGISAMLVDDWEGLDLEELLDAVDALVLTGAPPSDD